MLVSGSSMLLVDSAAVTKRTAVSEVMPGKHQPPVSSVIIALRDGVFGPIMVDRPVRRAVV